MCQTDSHNYLLKLDLKKVFCCFILFTYDKILEYFISSVQLEKKCRYIKKNGKHCINKEKILVTSIFSFFFTTFSTLSNFIISFVCNFFRFGQRNRRPKFRRLSIAFNVGFRSTPNYVKRAQLIPDKHSSFTNREFTVHHSN